MDSSLKSSLINNYLSQQLQLGGGAGGEDDAPRNMLQTVELPNNNALEEFKSQVRTWMEIDNQVKKLQQLIKERNAIKKQLSDKILGFMTRYNIEDLNTKEGKLRYKVSVVKAPVTRTAIKERVVELYGKTESAHELLEKVFESTEKKEKTSLRRIKPRGGA